ncbi:MAG TPA: hypothetical protein VIW21_09040, partial [Chthoniobacterales bacterium]
DPTRCPLGTDVTIGDLDLAHAGAQIFEHDFPFFRLRRAVGATNGNHMVYTIAAHFMTEDAQRVIRGGLLGRSGCGRGQQH